VIDDGGLPRLLADQRTQSVRILKRNTHSGNVFDVRVDLEDGRSVSASATLIDAAATVAADKLLRGFIDAA